MNEPDVFSVDLSRADSDGPLFMDMIILTRCLGIPDEHLELFKNFLRDNGVSEIGELFDFNQAHDLAFKFCDEYKKINWGLAEFVSEFFSKNKGSGRKRDPQLTYLMRDNTTKLYKIGKSSNPTFREKTLQSQKPSIDLIHVMELDIERDLHGLYEDKRIRGEWFKLSDEDIDFIKSL